MKELKDTYDISVDNMKDIQQNLPGFKKESSKVYIT